MMDTERKQQGLYFFTDTTGSTLEATATGDRIATLISNLKHEEDIHEGDGEQDFDDTSSNQKNRATSSNHVVLRTLTTSILK
jgi:hypothetical protein